jgi:succinoglycan biosynthesis protein ExoO
LVDLNRMSVTPSVSVIMANHNGARFLEASIASVLGQSLHNLELLFCDDASSDESLAIAQRIAAADPRLRVLAADRNGGPAVARNSGLDAARGEWIAIVDSDDLIHPLRLERMIARAGDLGADIVADDLVYFGANLGRTLLGDLGLSRPWQPSAAEFLGAEMADPPIPVGYLKPVFRRDAIRDIRYRTYMTVGEDFDLLVRAVLGGAALAVLPEAYYLYRRHADSISHRLSARNVEGMIRAGDELTENLPQGLETLMEQRRRMQVRARDFAALVEKLKGPGKGLALRDLARNPALAQPLVQACRERLARRFSRRPGSAGATDLSLLGENTTSDETGSFREWRVPDEASGWTPARAAELAAAAGAGPIRLRAHGRAGLEALGYVPGWAEAELIPPENGWTEPERRRIAALPWPVRMA